MPNIIQGQSVIEDLRGVEYDYDYPGELDLRPGKELHKYIRNEVFRRARESHNKISKRFNSWNDVDEVLTAYSDVDEDEKKVKDEDKRKPTSVVFPYSYAIMETLLTYLVMAFFQEPILRYEGVSPDDVIGAILLEKPIELHCNKTKVPLNLHTMFRDGLGYGIGIGAPKWEVKRGDKAVLAEKGMWSSL